jgi:probable phosphoglycerate mutase
VRALPADPGHLIVSCDGASRGNPGPAGIGAQITNETGAILGEVAEGIGETTNNVAEYTAVIEGLSLAAKLGAKTVTLRSDSLLLVNQLTGRYRVKSEHLQPLHRRARSLAAGFERIAFEHVPREQNTAADALANIGVDRWLAGER